MMARLYRIQLSGTVGKNGASAGRGRLDRPGRLLAAASECRCRVLPLRRDTVSDATCEGSPAALTLPTVAGTGLRLAVASAGRQNVPRSVDERPTAAAAGARARVKSVRTSVGDSTATRGSSRVDPTPAGTASVRLFHRHEPAADRGPPAAAAVLAVTFADDRRVTSGGRVDR